MVLDSSFMQTIICPSTFMFKKGNCTAKYELHPVLLVKSKKFSSKELKEIHTIIEINIVTLKNKWNEFFDGH